MNPSDRALLWYFVKKDLIAQYKGSFFGAFWNVLYPFLFMMIFAFIFGFLFGGRRSAGSMQSYVLVVTSGFMYWLVFSAAMTSGTRAFIANAGYIKKNTFPKNILFLKIVISEFIRQCILLAIYLGIYVYINHRISVGFLYLFPVMFVFMFLCYGFSQILGVLTPYFKDLSQVISLILRLVFYLSCVLYGIENIPEDFHSVYLRLNPLASFIVFSRYLVFGINGQYVHDCLLSIGVWTLFAFVAGNLAVKAVEKDIADVL